MRKVKANLCICCVAALLAAGFGETVPVDAVTINVETASRIAVMSEVQEEENTDTEKESIEEITTAAETTTESETITKIETTTAAADNTKQNTTKADTKNKVVRKGWYTKKGKKYYYNSKGKPVTGWRTINKKKYYFNKKGVLQTNQIVGSKKAGYYYVDSTGVRVTSSEIKLAVKFVTAHTKTGWSQSKKLKACYEYLWKYTSYQRAYGLPNASNLSSYASYMLKNKKGNCFQYAASFAAIAKVLGYESRVAVGSISSYSGGMTPHGWTEIKVNGKWYLCDVNMQKEHPSINSYMKTDSSYAYRHRCNKRYKLKISKGKVSWK